MLVHKISSMKSIATIAACFFLVSCAFAEPLLLQGLIDNGALILRRADPGFLNTVESTVQKASSASPGLLPDSLQKLVDSTLRSVTDTAHSGDAAVLFAPAGVSEIFVAPIVLSESIAGELRETAETALRVVTPQLEHSDSESSNHVGSILSQLSGLQLNGIAERSASSLTEAVQQSIDFVQSPIALLQRNAAESLRGAGSLLPVDALIGPLQLLLTPGQE